MTTTGSPVQRLAAAVDELLDAAWWALSDGDLGAGLLALERQAARLEAVRLRVLAEADGRALGVAPTSIAGAPVTAYSEGGSTSERNRACLCGYHHRLVHRQGWRGESPTSGRCPHVGAQVVWHPPDRSSPELPPPPWLPALERLAQRWASRAA